MARRKINPATRIKSAAKPAQPARPYTSKPRTLEPRGRTPKGQAAISGATPADPLVAVQVLKVRRSVWNELAEAAAERTWHRSVLVRKILDEWVERRVAARKRRKSS